MGSLRRATLTAFFALELSLKFVFERAFCLAFAPGPDHGEITRTYLHATIPITLLWLAVVAVLTGRIDRLCRSRAPAQVAQAGDALSHLPNRLALAWCVEWCATVACVALDARPLVAPEAVTCLLLSVAMGSSVLGHALTVWLAEARLRRLPRPPSAPPAEIPYSLRLRLAAYGLGMCGAPTMYVASLAFSVRIYPMPTSALTTEILYQTGAIAGFAVSSAALLALSIIGPVRQMATIMRAIARGSRYTSIDRIPWLRDDELGALSESTNHMLDRLEHSDRERRALHATLENRVLERTAALAAANGRLEDEVEARGKVELELRRELDDASSIFARMAARGEFERGKVRHLVRAAERLAGDFVFGATTSSGAYRWMLGDVTGHSLSSALATLTIATVFYDRSAAHPTITDLLTTMDRELCAALPPNKFCVGAIAELDRRSGTLEVWNGGCPDLFIRRAAGGVTVIPSSSPPLAANRWQPAGHVVARYTVEPGDRILAFSDGLVELRDADGKMLGLDRLRDVVASGPADTVYDRLLAHVPSGDPAGADPRADDDISLIEIVV